MPSPGQRPSSSSRDLTLVVESESGTLKEIYAHVGLSIGRADSNDFHIDHPDVDHIHAKVIKQGEAFWLRAEPPAKLPLLEPEPGEVEQVQLAPGLVLRLGGVTLRCRQQVQGMSGLSDDYWAEAAGGERFRVETEDFTGDLPKKIGPYEIRKFVARGGMGIVLQGIHSDTAQPAAVKLPTPDLNKDQQWLRRFEQEVRTLKSVEHPNLVRLQDAGTEGELHWMAMDWVEGGTISERLTQYKKIGAPMPFDEIKRILKQVAAGLKHLHSQNVVHRDLKPSNLLMGRDGSVKVADFGLAKQVDGEQSTLFTRTGTMAGTMYYMAPEQAEGMEITPATDVYALGVIWHELLTGKKPDAGGFKLRTLRNDCPEDWIDLVEKCLDDEPTNRPRLETIKNALKTDRQSAGVEPENKKSGRRIIAIMAGFVGLLVLWALFPDVGGEKASFQSQKTSPNPVPPNPVPSVLATKTGIPIWEYETRGRVTSSPAIGSDGTIYVGSSYPDFKLYAINGKSGNMLWEFETGGPVHSSPAIGPDGTVYVGSFKKKLYAINGKSGNMLWEFETGGFVLSSPAIGSDGTVYVGSDDNKLYAIKTDSKGLAKSPWPMRGQNPQHTARAP